MGEPRIGSLCSGYGGLDMGVQAAIGGELAWVSDIDKGANKILAHRHPDVRNIGDFTTIYLPSLDPIDILTAGFPCQPVSGAGKRLGDQDERWLWDDVARAVRVLRPRLVVLENVRGLLTARGGRLFGRVLGTLDDLGYDVRWHGLRAADVGAPHPRFRVFIAAQDAHVEPRQQRWLTASSETEGGRSWADAGRRGGAPAADARGQRHGQGQDDRSLGRVDRQDESGSREREWAREVTAHRGRETWGGYTSAVHRWELVIGRPAPDPTEFGRTQSVLSPRFVEWMMGLPAGWVTDVPDLSRDEQFRALGNGVVPQQAEAALQRMLDRAVAA